MALYTQPNFDEIWWIKLSQPICTRNVWLFALRFYWMCSTIRTWHFCWKNLAGLLCWKNTCNGVLPIKNHFKFVIYNLFVFFLSSLNNLLKYMYITYGIYIECSKIWSHFCCGFVAHTRAPQTQSFLQVKLCIACQSGV